MTTPLKAGSIVYRVVEVDPPDDGPHTWKVANVTVEKASDRQVKLLTYCPGLALKLFKPDALGRVFFESPLQAIQFFLTEKRMELESLDRKTKIAARALAWATSQCAPPVNDECRWCGHQRAADGSSEHAEGCSDQIAASHVGHTPPGEECDPHEFVGKDRQCIKCLGDFSAKPPAFNMAPALVEMAPVGLSPLGQALADGLRESPVVKAAPPWEPPGGLVRPPHRSPRQLKPR